MQSTYKKLVGERVVNLILESHDWGLEIPIKCKYWISFAELTDRCVYFTVIGYKLRTALYYSTTLQLDLDNSRE